MTSFFVLIIAVVTALTCALIGNFLVLRRLAMLGDAMSHAVLPGILVGYLIARDLQSPLFFLGAVMFCVIMAVAIEALIKNRFIREESAIGIAFTSLFALIFVLYGGFTWTTAAGSEEKVKKGKNILQWALIGLVVIGAAWSIITYVMATISQVI